MSVYLSPVGGAGAQFFDNNGNPLTGGKLYTYAAGTTTPQATYTSAAGSTFHTNPIVLDAAGRVPGSSEIWLADSQIYKFVLKDSNDVLLATWDQITGVNSNFVNYTTETEVQTATAGQTVFTLTTMSYAPGTGSLTVFVDGVNQYEGTSYLETNSTTVTFTAGLHVGALVKFTTAVQTTGNATDASVVSYTPPFTGSAATTVQDKLAQTVSVKDFGAVGDGVTDDTAAIQAAIDSLSASGGQIYIPKGTYSVTTELAVAGNYVEICLDQAAVLSYNTPTYQCFNWTGNYGQLTGGKLLGPASWDGANVAPTYAVVDIHGSGMTVGNIQLYNIRKVGIRFKDVDNGTVSKCLIFGNYPSASWTGTETVHYGVQCDPGTGDQGGNFNISNNNINTCVQGCFAGNYGSGQPIQGLVFSDNNVSDCWNHGIYLSDGHGAAITGNAFNRCQTPIAVTGSSHVVSSNTLYSKFAGSGTDQRDYVGISLRDPYECVVTSNTLRGNAFNNSSIIDLRNTALGNEIAYNIVSNNVIDCPTGTSVGIKINTVFAAQVYANTISNNIVKCVGRPSQGVIYLSASAGYATNNDVVGNKCVVIGETNGVALTNQTNSIVANNNISFECDLAAPATLGGIYISGSTGLQLNNNNVFVSSSWGTNIALRGVWEDAATAASYTQSNITRANLTKLTSATPFVFDTVGTVINEMGTDAPTVNAGVGSMWRRLNGGASTTLYIKESGSGGIGWVAK